MKYILFLIFGVLYTAEVEKLPFILSILESNLNILSGTEDTDIYSVDDMISYAAMKYDLDPYLIRALIQVESGFKHQSISSAGAVGYMQLMAATAAELNVNRYDELSNILGGTFYLLKLINRFGGIHDGLIAYNCGPGNLERKTIPEESHAYAHKVMTLYKNLKMEDNK